MSNDSDPIQSAGPEALGQSRTPRECREIAQGVHFLAGFGNTTIVIGTEAAAVIDPGLFTNGPRVVEELRHLTDRPLRYVIYTHGHYDHALGTPALLEDAASRGHPPPDIVGHVNVAKRFERYAKTAGHLAGTFDSQFAAWGPGGGDVVRRARYFPPTMPYEDRLLLDGLGGLPIECRHGLGETDDHTWVWIPGPKVIVGGDFVVSSLPNAGTPFRVQRYVLEWAEALEEMAALEPSAIVSGHGGVFREHGEEMLLTTARALQFLDGEVVRRLNDGQWQEQILTEVELPEDLDSSPYLQPLYGCTPFVVRDVMRRYMGWYDGNPSTLFPSTRADIAGEVVLLAGGAAPLLDRARVLSASDSTSDVQRALHLVDFVLFDDGPMVSEARALKAELLETRSKQERSFVSHNILASAAVLERERGSTA
ncbi:MAG: alkyl sulfatase dimerization domain-containing protein [Acidimicrobiales bacterium]